MTKWPMSTTQRTHNYYAMNGCQKLTPRQVRRLQHKYNRTLRGQTLPA